MSTTPPPSPAAPVVTGSIDPAAIGRLIREELDRNNKYLEFAQGQIEKDRGFYKYLYGWAVAFIGFMIVVAGFFQFTSVTQMRTDMKASVDAELERDKAEIAALRAQAQQANAESQYSVSKELANVRIEVQNRIDTEFQADNIKTQIAAAAKDRTEKEFTGIIRSVTSDLVTKGIAAEHPFIQKTVEDQTKDSVKALQPTISSLVSTATNDQVTKTVQPIKSQMDGYGDYIRIGTLVMLANNDDRPAFDTLLQIAMRKSRESANPDLFALADSTLASIISAKQSGFRISHTFNQQQTPAALKNFMKSPSPYDREAAVDAYPAEDKSIIPLLVEVVKSDTSIEVLARAIERFNALTKQSFRIFQASQLLDWWAKNQKSFQ